MVSLGTLMPMVKGDVFTEDIGACGPDCSSRCTSAHPGAKAGCDLNNNNPVCRCFYDCGPPLPPPYSKKCKISLGKWGENCSESDCNSQCASKYPGPQEGSGYCYSTNLMKRLVQYWTKKVLSMLVPFSLINVSPSMEQT
ncbi:defensin-like protein 182 [Pyrus ussuriensis x Pyrus communis]|uniref:Defensin-like protein n=1 Tax=Pyrus ussuriensis x Pyrus communis TaxID=2448454 RepID=A0A5N5I7D9_9ROSA|nr:defensin-like protein 182 [Pyrus ussuriensis x Pyrus communis]